MHTLSTNDQKKLINAGFRILRADYFRLRIKYKDARDASHWKFYRADFDSKRAVEAKMKELLTHPKNIEA